jgi:hypothetical protein
MRAICECLQADDVVISERTLAAYVSRMRKRLENPTSINPPPVGDELEEASERGRRTILAAHRRADKSADPLENLRARDDSHRLFDYRPELADPKKLI